MFTATDAICESMAGRVIMRVAYGIDIQAHDDPYVEIGEKSLQALCAAANAGAFLVDSLPFCALLSMLNAWPDLIKLRDVVKYIPEWFPGASFQVKAKNWRPWAQGMLNKPFELVKQRVVGIRYIRLNCLSLLTRSVGRRHCC